MQDISPQGGECPSFSLSRGQAVPPIQRCAAGGEKRPISGREEWPPAAAGNAGVHRRECRRLAAETKGGKGTIWFPCPLLTPPNPPLRRDSLWSRGETGETGLSSVRRFAFGTLLCPEFSLHYPPRITVRGHPVQSGSVLLRKAPLRSRACPWSTKRPCGPLAFRRATEGSRVPRKGWGVKRGRETLVSLPLLPPPPGGGTPHAMSWRITPCPGGPLSPAAASRRNGGTAHPLLRVKAMGRTVASTGCAAVSAQGPPSADGKKTARPPGRRQVSPLCQGENLFYFSS